MAIFARTAAQFGKMAADYRGLGGGIKNAADALKNTAVSGGGFMGRMADRTVNAAVWTARAPGAAMNKAFEKFPRISLVAGAGALVYGAFRLIRGRAETRTERELAQQMAQTPMAPTANTYYQVSPEEYAAMEARMRQGGAAPGGHSQKVMADRASAAQQAGATV